MNNKIPDINVSFEIIREMKTVREIIELEEAIQDEL